MHQASKVTLDAAILPWQGTTDEPVAHFTREARWVWLSELGQLLSTARKASL